MNKHTLSVKPREVLGRKVKSLRFQDLLPAHVYGDQITSLNIQVPQKEFQASYSQVGESSLLYLEVAGESVSRPVFVTDVSRDPLTNKPIHISFHQVNLKEKVTAPVKIELVGESPAVRDNLGILVQQQGEAEIEALPTDMPEHLELDITTLVEVGDSLYLKDLKLGSNLVLKSDPESIVVKIEAHAKEEVVETLSATDTPNLPENPDASAAPAADGEPQN